MTRDDFEAQFHRAVTEAREGHTGRAVRRILDAAEDYAETRAGQILISAVEQRRQGRKRLSVAADEKYGRTA
jgi:hypothetical protein